MTKLQSGATTWQGFRKSLLEGVSGWGWITTQHLLWGVLSGSQGLARKQTPKKSLFLSLTDKMQPLPWSLEMSPSASQNAPGFWGLCWFSLAPWHEEGVKQQVCIMRELKFPSDNYTIKKSPLSSFHRTAAPFLGCLWRTDYQTNTESSTQAGKRETELFTKQLPPFL